MRYVLRKWSPHFGRYRRHNSLFLMIYKIPFLFETGFSLLETLLVILDSYLQTFFPLTVKFRPSLSSKKLAFGFWDGGGGAIVSWWSFW